MSAHTDLVDLGYGLYPELGWLYLHRTDWFANTAAEIKSPVYRRRRADGLYEIVSAETVLPALLKARRAHDAGARQMIGDCPVG